MKKTLLIPALLSIMLLMNCENEEINPFVGTWESEDNGFRIVFTKTNISGKSQDGASHYKGTYTYDDTHLTIRLDFEQSMESYVESWGESHTIPYRFEDGYLLLNVDRMRFKKID